MTGRIWCRRGALGLFVALVTLLTGCWDRSEVEDMLFPVTVAVDAGTSRHYRVTMRVPIPGGVRSGVLGGQGAGSARGDILSAESDSVSQAMLIINSSVARRMTLRHMRSLLVGEELARRGLHDLFAEMRRNGEIRQTVAFLVARGRAADVLKTSRYTAETNPAKVPEGMLIVEKYLHLAPPIRLHHMINRTAGVGIDAFAPVVAINRRLTGDDPEGGGGESESGYAGQLERFDGNPVEVAGTAIFRGERMVGLLTVDETQALLALRGEMGKAYMTIPHPKQKTRRVLVRFQQENKPISRVELTPAGPRGTASLLFEGEVLSGEADYRDQMKRMALEETAAQFMTDTAHSVLRKLKAWESDPVGYGLKIRRRFGTWAEWKAFRWEKHVGAMEIRVTARMRVRRFGLVMGSEEVRTGAPSK
ncbi:MAG TPA: Ger(x)C family spore germination protein [Symbiobacteriaceae bacterium]|jgi:spore germination protein KC|nr:Ger(x)C family spore germination protein [Symbiobacteriaceae bacterium]